MDNITPIAKMVAESVEKIIGDQTSPTTLTTIEQITRTVLHTIGGAVVERVASAQLSKFPDQSTACSCGGKAIYQRKRKAQFHTMLGTVSWQRHYYVCPHCHQGQVPLDEQLGVRPNQMSPLKSQLVAQVGVQLPFERGRHLFENLTLIPISDVSISKATYQQGKQVEGQEQRSLLEATDIETLRHTQQTTARPLRLYGSVDAVKINVRHTDGVRWRDLKVGAWFEAVGKPPNSPDGDWKIVAQKIDYFADMTIASEFSSLVWASGVQRQAQLAHELIFIADGATWIWNIVTDNFPRAVQILDWFHAVEHLAPVAQTLFDSAEERADWCNQMKEWLWDGDLILFFEQFDTLLLTSDADIVRTTRAYYLTHKERIRYAFFRQQGYQIGSGTIESAAKQIGIMRMKVPGAIWGEANAPLMAKARASFLSHTSSWASLPLAF